MSRGLPHGLSDKVRALMAPHVAPDFELLNQISEVLVGKRGKAVDARKSSGIEMIWHEAERAYACIDDANAHLHAGSRWQKGMTPNDPMTKRSAIEEIKSNIYMPLTPRYTDAGAAKVGEILVSIDEKSFGIEETPVPTLVDLKDNTDQAIGPTTGVPLTRPAKDGEVPSERAQGQEKPRVPLTNADVAKDEIAKAHAAAKKAETRMDDWLSECQYSDETRKIIFDSARLGVGVLKGPYPIATTDRAVRKTADGLELVEVETVKPAAKWIDPWNAFPDPHCGENVRDGDFFFERDLLTEAQVIALKDQPGYIASQIESVLEEGPNRANMLEENLRPGALQETEGRYPVWYFTGRLKREELDCICHAGGKPLRNNEAKGQSPSAVVTMINDTPVRAAPNPLESGALGYHSMPWRRRVGSWAGKGVPEQISPAQRMVNGAVRRLLDNAGLAAGAQIVLDPLAIIPADGNPLMTPNKTWHKTGDGSNMRIDQIFGLFEIPIYTAELLNIAEFGMRMAEEATSIPLITQGQSGPTTPDTFGAAQLQNNNANQLLRSLGYSYDGNITTPFIRLLYEWYLLDPSVPNEDKGDFKIIARGSAVLVERAIADQTIASMAGVAKDPAYGVNPKKWFAEWAKSQRLDPRNFQNTPEEQAAIDKAMQQTGDPRVEVARITAASREKIAEAVDHTKQTEIKSEATVELHALVQAKDATIQTLKAKLAETSMKLQVQQKLAADAAGAAGGGGRPRRRRPQRGGSIPQVVSAPTEPPRQAPDGQAFNA